MKAGVTTSVVAHVALLIVAIVGLGSAKPLQPEVVESIAVDLVPISDITNIRQGSLTSKVVKTDTPAVVKTDKPAEVAQKTGNTDKDQPTPKETDKQTPAPATNTAPKPSRSAATDARAGSGEGADARSAAGGGTDPSARAGRSAATAGGCRTEVGRGTGHADRRRCRRASRHSCRARRSKPKPDPKTAEVTPKKTDTPKKQTDQSKQPTPQTAKIADQVDADSSTTKSRAVPRPARAAIRRWARPPASRRR